MTTKLDCQRHLFDIPEDVHYINCAYMSPVMNRTTEIGKANLARKQRPYEIIADDFFTPVEEVKSKFTRLIGTNDPDRIAIIPSVSYAVSTVAHNVDLKEGGNIVVAGGQFPSNIYPWQALCDRRNGRLSVVDRPESNGNWSDAICDAINEETAAVAMGHIHWADGHIFNLHKISEKARSHGALVIIDGTQSIGALHFPIDDIKPDALICAAYKWLMGPYAIGLAYYGPYFDDKEPIEYSWINRLNSDDFKELVNYQPEYRPAAHRFNVGECSNFSHIPMLNSSLEQVLDWGVDNIQDYCKNLKSEFLSEWIRMGLTTDDESSANHLFGLRLPPDISLRQLKDSLAAQKIYVSLRGDAVRVSPHVYNTTRDLEALTTALGEAIHVA